MVDLHVGFQIVKICRYRQLCFFSGNCHHINFDWGVTKKNEEYNMVYLISFQIGIVQIFLLEERHSPTSEEVYFM